MAVEIRLTWKFMTPVQTRVDIKVATICAEKVCLGGIWYEIVR